MAAYPFLRIDEAVTRFRNPGDKAIHVRTLRRWLAKDDVPLTRLGNHIYISSDDLEEFIRRHTDGHQ